MKVVVDTNVIVSGLNFPGNERRVLDLARRGKYDLYLSGVIFEELAGVLRRKFRWDDGATTRAMRLVRAVATVTEPPRRACVIEGNQAGNRILDCAIAASADYLATGDRRRLLPLRGHMGTRIVSAARFLSIAESVGPT